MGRPKKIEGQIPTRERILSAAEMAFSESGLNGVRLSQIAENVGIRAPSLLYHFPTKQALYNEVIKRIFSQLERAVLDGMRTSGNLENQIQQLADTLVMLVSTRKTFLRLVVREILSPIQDKSPAIEGLRRLVDVLTFFLVDRGAGSDDIPVREAVMQLISGFLLRGSAAPSVSPLWTSQPATEAMAFRLLVADGSSPNECLNFPYEQGVSGHG